MNAYVKSNIDLLHQILGVKPTSCPTYATLHHRIFNAIFDSSTVNSAHSDTLNSGEYSRFSSPVASCEIVAIISNLTDGSFRKFKNPSGKTCVTRQTSGPSASAHVENARTGNNDSMRMRIAYNSKLKSYLLDRQ